jgi:hypothetical protein
MPGQQSRWPESFGVHGLKQESPMESLGTVIADSHPGSLWTITTLGTRRSDGASSQHKMQDQRDYGEHE